MAAIKHTELFDFPAYEAAIKDVKEATEQFGRSAEDILRRLATQQKTLSQQLAAYAAELKNFNVAVGSARQALTQYNGAVDAVTQNMAELKTVEDGVTATMNLQRAAVAQLDKQYADLLQQLAELNPQSKEYAKNAKAIKDQISQTLAGIKAYSQGVKNAATATAAANGSYKAMQQQLTELRNRLKSIPGAFDEVTGKMNRNNREAVALSKEIARLDGALKKADAQMGIYTRNVGNYSSALKGLGGAFAATVGITSAFELQRAIFDVNREFEGLNNAIRLVSGSGDEFAKNQELLTNVAQKYGLEITGLTQAFKQFFAASTAAGVEADQARRIFEQVSNVAANLKLSTQDVNGVFTAFGQILSKGKVQAEELRGQIGERIPGAFSIAAKAIGVTQQELNKMLEQGQVIADDFLPKFAAELEKTFGREEQVESLNASVNRLFNSFRTGVESENLTKFLTRVIDLTAQGVDGLFQMLDAITNVDRLVATFGNPLQIFSLDPNSNEDAIREQVAAQIRVASEAARAEIAKERKRTQERIDSIDKDFRDKEKSEQLKTLQFQKQIAREKVALLNAEKDPKRRQTLLSEAKFESDVLSKLVASYEELNAVKSGAPKKKTDGDKKTGPTAEELLAKDIKTRQELLRREAELNIAQNELLLAEKKISEVEFQEAKLQIISDYIDAAIDLEKRKGADADLSTIDEFNKKAINAKTEYVKAIEKLNETEKENRIKSQNETLARIKGDFAKFGAQRKEETERAFQDEIDAENKAYALATAGRDATFKEEQDHLDRLKAIKQKYLKDTSEEELASARLTGELRRQLEVQQQQLYFDAAAAGITIIQDQFNAAADERLAKLDQERERQLAAAGNNAAAREAIEQRFNRRVAEEKRKQARADKVFALFNVALNTAQGIARTIAQFGMPGAVPFLPLVIAQGAIQAAVIAARPIPAFRKGTKSAPAGLAIVGEEGAEIIEKNGKMSITPNRASFVKLTGGEKIYTAKETTRILETAAKTHTIERVLAADVKTAGVAMATQAAIEAARARSIGEAVRLNEKALESAFARSVGSIPVSHTSFDERGVRRWTEEKNARTEYINSRKIGR